MARTLDPLSVVDPVAVLVAQYRLAIVAIAKKITAGQLRPNSYLARQVPFILAALGGLDSFSKKWADKYIASAYKTGAAAAQAELLRARVLVVQGLSLIHI